MRLHLLTPVLYLHQHREHKVLFIRLSIAKADETDVDVRCAALTALSGTLLDYLAANLDLRTLAYS